MIVSSIISWVHVFKQSIYSFIIRDRLKFETFKSRSLCVYLFSLFSCCYLIIEIAFHPETFALTCKQERLSLWISLSSHTSRPRFARATRHSYHPRLPTYHTTDAHVPCIILWKRTVYLLYYAVL